MKKLLHSRKLLAPTLAVALLGCHPQESSPDHHSDHAPEAEHAHDDHETKGEEAHSDHEGEHAEGMQVVELSPQQIEAVGVQTGPLSKLPLKDSVKANGVLELPPQNKADVSALVSGAIRKINVLEGDRVKKGQVLALLEDPHIIDVQQDYVEASERLAYLEEEFNRKKRLLDEGVGSKREFQQVASDYRSVRAKAAGLGEKLKLLGLNPDEATDGSIRSAVPIRAPMGGHVRLVEVNTGSYVKPGQRLFEIVDNEHIHIDLQVYEKDLHKVKEDQIVRFRYTNQPDDKVYEARIFAVGKAFEQDPKAVRVHAELTKQHPDLLPGMYVEAWIVTASEEVPALPEGAVVSEGGVDYIFVHEEHEGDGAIHTAPSEGHGHGLRFKPVAVKTGVKENGFVEIKLLEELPKQIQVVTKGAFFLLSEMKKGEGGHHH